MNDFLLVLVCLIAFFAARQMTVSLGKGLYYLFHYFCQWRENRKRKCLTIE